MIVGVMAGGMVGQKEIHGADQFSGEAGRAEKWLEWLPQREASERAVPGTATESAPEPAAR